MAYLVEDVERAAERFIARGAGPFFWRHHAPAEAVDGEGRTAQFVHSSAYGQWGELQLELVSVDPGTPDWLAEALRTPGGLHHMAHFVGSFATAQKELAARGWPATMTATTANGSQFAFHDARSELGHFVEIYERTAGVAALYDKLVAVHRDWGGADPLRSV